jgi:hypothetical protein
MDAAQSTWAQWRRWWAFGLVAVGSVVAGLAGVFVPDQPKGHWSGHVASGLIAFGQLVALLLGVVLVWRRLRRLLLVPLAVVAMGLVLEMATTSAPRPNTTAANQISPPRIGTRATIRKIAQPTRNATTQALGGRSSDRPRTQALAP